MAGVAFRIAWRSLEPSITTARVIFWPPLRVSWIDFGQSCDVAADEAAVRAGLADDRHVRDLGEDVVEALTGEFGESVPEHHNMGRGIDLGLFRAPRRPAGALRRMRGAFGAGCAGAGLILDAEEAAEAEAGLRLRPLDGRACRDNIAAGEAAGERLRLT